MSEFSDKAAVAVKESAGRSALEASTKLSELFMEASKNGNQESFKTDMDEKLKDVLPSLSIVSFQKDDFVKNYDADGDGAVSDKEMDAAIKSDKTSQKDKLMLEHLAKQYEALKNQNQKDGKDGGNANGVTNADVETYLSNNPKEKPLLTNGSTTRNFGTWQETTQPDGTIVKMANGQVFQFVPKGDYSKCSNIETQATGKITVNGKEVQVAPTDKVSMDDKGSVTIGHADNTSEVHHASGIVEKKNDKGEVVDIQGNGVHVVRDASGKWYVPGDSNAKPPTENMYLPDGKKPEIGKDGSISLDFGTWQQRNLPDGTIVKTADGKVFEFVPQGDWNRLCHWNGTEWVGKDGKPTKVKLVEVDVDGNVKVTHKDNSYNVYHPDGSYAVYDENGIKKCDVDAATAKATNDKKSELQELSKIESGKGPYDSAKKMLEAAGVSPLTHKVILEFARWMRDKVAQKTSFRAGEQLVGDDNWQPVADKINEIKASQKK